MRNILITGASRGIGRAAAIRFAASNTRLFLNCLRSEDKIRELAVQLEEKTGCLCVPLVYDVADYSAVEEMFRQIHSVCDGPDVLINNAGISNIGLLQDMTIEEWNRLINTNLTSVFSCCKLAIPSMIRAHAGKIINISSMWGVDGASCETAYSASKGGVNALTKGLAKELAPSGIQVNAIACGVIDTDMNRCFSDEERSELAEEIPAGRFGQPEEVAELIYGLANGHDYLTGQIIVLDGGYL